MASNAASLAISNSSATVTSEPSAFSTDSYLPNTETALPKHAVSKSAPLNPKA